MRTHRPSIFSKTFLFSGAVSALGSFCPPARADPTVEILKATGFGALVAGVTPARFTISPTASVGAPGERGFFVAQMPVLSAP